MTETPPETQHIEGEVILEPGDPGYVAPQDKPAEQTEQNQGGYTDPNEKPPLEPRVGSVPEGDAPLGQDLTHVRNAHESDADFAARTRGVVVDSQSPTDIVPNTPQTTMGARVAVEGSDPPVFTAVPSETISPQEGEEDVEQPENPPGAGYVAETPGGDPHTGEPGDTPANPSEPAPVTEEHTENVPVDTHTGEGQPAA